MTVHKVNSCICLFTTSHAVSITSVCGGRKVESNIACTSCLLKLTKNRGQLIVGLQNGKTVKAN